MIKREKDGIVWFEFGNLTAAGVRHCFTTRIGGVSTNGYASLNLGLHNGDSTANVRKNFSLVCDAVGFNADNVVFSNQVHGTNVVSVCEGLGNMQRVKSEADGLITNKDNIAIATYYADCVPMLFYDPIKKVIANSHAGWRGVVGNIASKTIQAMKTSYGSRSQDLLVAIAPSICVKCFEVDIDVYENFKKYLPFSDKFVYNSPSVQNKFHIDLQQICCESSILEGIPRENIEIAAICTHEYEDLFFSHRRSQGAPRGNMLAMIQM